MTDAERYVLSVHPDARAVYNSDSGKFTVVVPPKDEAFIWFLSNPWQSESMVWHEAAMKLGRIYGTRIPDEEANDVDGRGAGVAGSDGAEGGT